MTNITDRYASAVRSSNLKSKPDTTRSDSDVLGAVGFAGMRTRGALTDDPRPGHPLAMALLRMFTGGDAEARYVCEKMTRMAVGKAYRMGRPIGEAGADLLAGLVLAWHRDSACKACGGHGFKTASGVLGDGRAVIGDAACGECRGSTKRPFDSLFPAEHLELARWLRAEVERETAKAGPAAMAALAERMNL